MSTRSKAFWRNETGATAALYALALPALVAVAGVGFDYARLAGMDSELQNAADQAALAAVTQLDGKNAASSPSGVGACQRAVDAAQGGLVKNLTWLASDSGASGKTTTVSVPTVVFYATAADAEAGANAFDATASTCDSDAKFVGVTVQERTAQFAFTPIVAAFSGDSHAEGVAGLGSAICKAAVMFMCNPTNDANFNVADYIGVGVEVGGSKVGSGNWGFIGDDPDNNTRAQVLGWNAPPDTCIAVGSKVDVNTGNNTNDKVRNAFNTRFDMGSCPSGGNCSSSVNVTKDLVVPQGASTPPADGDWMEAGKPYAPAAGTLNPLTSDYPEAMGYPRDICHASGGDCRTRGPSGAPESVGDGVWDIDAYFRVNYGLDQAGWIASTGLASNAMRYDVYKWEMNQPVGTMLNSQAVLGPRSFTSPATNKKGEVTDPNRQLQTRSRGGQSFPAVTPGPGTVDRRLVTMAVVSQADCAGLHGNHPVQVQKWIDVFLVEPIFARTETYKNGGGTEDKAIYIEIVRETPMGGQGENPVRRDVPYLVR